jgi:hypothetical protein
LNCMPTRTDIFGEIPVKAPLRERTGAVRGSAHPARRAELFGPAPRDDEVLICEGAIA